MGLAKSVKIQFILVSSCASPLSDSLRSLVYLTCSQGVLSLIECYRSVAKISRCDISVGRPDFWVSEQGKRNGKNIHIARNIGACIS